MIIRNGIFQQLVQWQRRSDIIICQIFNVGVVTIVRGVARNLEKGVLL